MERIGLFAVPFFLTAIGLLMLFSSRPLFDAFLVGAREGLDTCFRILPTLVLLMTAVRMFTASGAMQALCTALGGAARALRVPEQMLPLLLVRPISGSAATAVMQSLLDSAGPDSFAGRAASILLGSSDTILYTLAMYFSAAGTKKTRYALPAAFLVFLFCTSLSCLLARLFFGG